MNKLFILSMLLPLAMVCSCQKQDSTAEQQLAQRKVELDPREKALDERLNALDARVNALDEKVKALAEKETAALNARTIPTDVQPQISDPAQVQAERDAAIQRFSTEIRTRIPDNSKVKAEKDRVTQERPQRQSGQAGSQSQKQYKFQQAQKAWMSGAAVSPAVQGAAPTTPTPSPAVEATSPTSSPAVQATSPTLSPTP